MNWNKTAFMAHIKDNKFDKKLKDELNKFKENTGRSLRSIAKASSIGYETLYRFAENPGGMNGENTYKLMQYLGIEIGEL